MPQRDVKAPAVAPAPRVPGRVSVVVASYNHARHLQKRLESLLGQTYRDLEIVAIDDQSTDDSFEVLQQFADRPNVLVIRRPVNGGWVATFNEGMSASSGEFVLFANCDDECDPTQVSRLVDAMDAHPTAGIAFCRSLLIDAEGRALGEDFDYREPAFQKRCAADTLISGREMCRFLLHACIIPNTGAALIRRECFDTLGPFGNDYRVIGDWEFFFRVASKYDVAYVAAPLNHFRQHEGTIRNTTKARLICAEYLRLLLTRLRNLDLSWWERSKYRSRAMTLWAIHLISPTAKGYRDFRHHLALVFKTDPAALLLFPYAVGRRCCEVVGKLVVGRRRLPGVA